MEGDVGEVLRAVQKGEFTPPRRHDPVIDRALEAVCLKAMAHKPTDRYASPKALAEDVERWMADETVSAWREPWTRTLVRWLTRHRVGVTAAGAAVLVALVGTAAVLGVQTRANAELKSANVDLAIANRKVTRANADLQAANERERQRFDLAMEAVKLFHGEVSEDLLLKEKQFAGLRSRLLKGAADFYGKLERLLEGQSDAQSRAALGRAYFELGELTSKIGTSAEALAVHRKGLAVRRELAERPGADGEAVLDVVRSLLAEGVSLKLTGDDPGALASYKEALERAEGLVAAGRGADEARFELAECLESMSYDVAKRRPEEGLAMARRARRSGGKWPQRIPRSRAIRKVWALLCFLSVPYSLTWAGRPRVSRRMKKRSQFTRNWPAPSLMCTAGRIVWRCSTPTSLQGSSGWTSTTRWSRRVGEPWRSGGMRPSATPL